MKTSQTPVPSKRRFLPFALGVLVLGALLFLVTQRNRNDTRPAPVTEDQTGMGTAAESSLPPGPQQPAAATSTQQDSGTQALLQRGEELSRIVCAGCHLYPEPSLLDKVTWGMAVLPDMEVWMGIRTGEDLYDVLNAEPRVRAAKIIPTEPMLNLEDWRAICAYYLDAAPATALPKPPHSPLQIGLPGFEVEFADARVFPMVSLVHIDPQDQKIYIGSTSRQTTNALSILNLKGQREKIMPAPAPPVDIDITEDTLRVTFIGNYLPTDKLEGRIAAIGKPGSGNTGGRDLLTRLPRPTHTVFADLNLDGREDVVVCGYGNVLGSFSWFENLGGGQYKEHVIMERNGSIVAYVRDANGDGYPDIYVMTAQQREGIYLFINQKNGQFQQHALIEKHPAWGYAYFELVDWNGDGHMDIVTANGDNGDHVRRLPPYKAYHGIRIYLNDGNMNFTEAWFYPANGAFKAMVRDFDGDGDLDVASIAYYADYRESPGESFIYFQNQGGDFNFIPRTFSQTTSGRWLTMDCGDVDGDGDLDIVLGAFNEGPSHVPVKLHEKWLSEGPPVVILRNQLRQPSP